MAMKLEITKQINLGQNDGLSSINGLAAQQHHEVYEAFYTFIEEVKPARILEIGTALGGFTQFLKRCTVDLKLNTDIRSYDIHEMNWYKDIRAEGIDVRVENIFSPDYSSCFPEVIDYIKQPGETVVLCDGGDKVREFRLLSKYLKPGDFIMAHDYAESLEIFNTRIKGKRWNWCEIVDGDIADSVKENDLVEYATGLFENVVWVCKLKV
jgi:23S rRNA U2552 (ribose-2'-O)-methylase RlmE/FtsJ